MSTAAPAAVLDLTEEVCPATWVKTRSALEALAAGEVLELRISAGGPLRSIPASVKDIGHTITAVRRQPDSTFRLSIEKAAARAARPSASTEDPQDHAAYLPRSPDGASVSS